MVATTVAAADRATTARGPARAGTVVRAGYAGLVTLLAAFLVYLLANPGQPSLLIGGWLVTGLELVASVLCLSRALLRWPQRSVPLVLGAALLAWSIGDVVLTIESAGGANPPSPSLADAFYLSFYPLAYVAVVLFMRAGVRQLSAPNWLDGAVAGLGAAALCATFAFHSILHTLGGSSLSIVTNLAYPVGDLLLLALIVGGTAVLGAGRRAAWLLLAGGMALNVVGDTFNLFGSVAAPSHIGTVLNGIAWPAAIVAMSAAVWVRPRPADPLAAVKPSGFLLPGLAATAGLAILLVGTVARPGAVAIGLAAGTLGLVGARLALSVRGLRALTVQRHRQSVTDELTGLGNRRFLFQVLDAFFADRADPRLTPRNLAFLFIDLNHFKEVNDSFGHPAGDQLLRQLGPRLSGALRPSDALVRLGGDEFAVVLLDTDATNAVRVAERLAGCLAEPFELQVVSARVDASIGIAVAPQDATSSAALVWCADSAMYRAKSAGNAIALYDPELDDGGNRLRLVEELRHAVERGELLLHYQPQLDLRSGQVKAVEALLRWPHPRLGLVPPLQFIPLAEEAGLIKPLTAWVLDAALAQCASWRAAGRQMAVSVNVSATNLLDPGFTDLVCGLLDQHQVPVSALVLEITETNIITEFDRAKDVVEGLRNRGLVVSIDDFGAGYTSLAYLSGLAVREVKLDTKFVAGLTGPGHERDLELVRATIELAHGLGLRVVAEGIEDEETLRLLSTLGCDVGQGYFIGTPRAAEDLALRPDQPPQKPVGDARTAPVSR